MRLLMKLSPFAGVLRCLTNATAIDLTLTRHILFELTFSLCDNWTILSLRSPIPGWPVVISPLLALDNASSALSHSHSPFMRHTLKRGISPVDFYWSWGIDLPITHHLLTIADQRWSSESNFHSVITKVTTPASWIPSASFHHGSSTIFPMRQKETYPTRLKYIFADCDTALESDDFHHAISW